MKMLKLINKTKATDKTMTIMQTTGNYTFSKSKMTRFNIYLCAYFTNLCGHYFEMHASVFIFLCVWFRLYY